MNRTSSVELLFSRLLSSQTKEKSEKVMLSIALISYALHLLLITLVNLHVLEIDSKFFKSPIAAIYTPFSFILVYEVYLLIFFLPKSITIYIGKQYEIITLIVVRRIFKDISHLELTSNWFQNRYDLQFTYDVVTALILFFLILLIYMNNKKRKTTRPLTEDAENRLKMSTFIRLKQVIATLLVPILLSLASFTLLDWTSEFIRNYQNGVIVFTNINKVFFDDFFTILIIVDVFLLLSSLFYSDEFHKIIRNSGFVISTILLKISFSVDGIMNNALIIGAVLFGYLILLIHDYYEKNALSEKQ
ncbi:MAG: hypothetical protein ACK4R6_13735 [Spirosomataceae bacterium]